MIHMMKSETLGLLLIIWINILGWLATIFISPGAINMAAGATFIFLIYLPIWLLVKWSERHDK